MKVINLEKLTELYGSRDASQEIIKMFIEQSDELISLLRSAVENQDQDTLYNLCHKAIGQCRYIAADPLEQELSILQNQQGDPTQHLKNIEDMIGTIQNDFS